MEREFEKLGKNLDSADLNDIMPSFDKHTEWANLQERLQEADKKRVIPIWFRYAAAVVVGLLLGGVSVNQWLTNTNTNVAIEQKVPSVLPTITINQPAPPQASTIEEMEPAQQIVAHVKKENVVIPVAKKEKPTEEQTTLTAVKKEQIQPSEIVEPIPIEKQKEIVAEVPQPIKRKTIHLLDIDNEDRDVVLNDPESSSSTFQNIMKQVAQTHTMTPAATNQPVLLRKMLKK